MLISKFTDSYLVPHGMKSGNLRSTTGDSRLNHLRMLRVHKDRTDVLTLADVANDFAGEKENQKQLFGKFSANDIPNKFSISSKSTQKEN